MRAMMSVQVPCSFGGCTMLPVPTHPAVGLLLAGNAQAALRAHQELPLLDARQPLNHSTRIRASRCT
jgi:hypothetical protein